VTTWKDLSATDATYAIDLGFYQGLMARMDSFELTIGFLVAPFTGRGVTVKAGQIVRVIKLEGPQIGDITFWNHHNPRERMSSLRTWALEGWFMKVFSRVWSDTPWLRPMATCIDESLDSRGPDRRIHHHSVACQCSTEQQEIRTGRPGLNSCRLNFLEAIEPFGLGERDIRENLDIFQGFLFEPESGRFVGVRSQGLRGDHIDFFCEMDLIIAVSVCPSGAGPTDWSGKDDGVRVLPLRVEVYDSDVEPQPFRGS
jgi:uncharacterized protein YcgI (DUF1989 family)